MNKKITIWISILFTSLTLTGIAIYNNYFYYLNLLIIDTPKYPTSYPLNNVVIYKFEPETILVSLDQGKTGVFTQALENPIYNDVPKLESQNSFSWNQEDFLKVGNELHHFVWGESLENWHLYSLGFSIPECNDISRINGAGLRFYQRHKNWYYLVHVMTIDMEYGYVYTGDNDGQYTGKWKDIDLNKVTINNFEKALLMAEENGGREARLALRNNQKCNININFPRPTYEHSKWEWEVTYWIDNGYSVIYRMAIDPYSGMYEIYEPRK